MKDNIKFRTNTAWLLNMWFKGNSKMWEDIRKWINEKHDRAWEGKNTHIVEVSFRILKKVEELKKEQN